MSAETVAGRRDIIRCCCCVCCSTATAAAWSVRAPSNERRRQWGSAICAAHQHPDHDTIAAFRQQHLEIVSGLFLQTLQLCQKAGLIKLGHVALEGSKIQANARQHKAMSYGRMGEAERRLQTEVEDLLKRATEAILLSLKDPITRSSGWFSTPGQHPQQSGSRNAARRTAGICGEDLLGHGKSTVRLHRG